MDIDVIREALADQVNTYASPYLRMLPELEDQVNPPIGIVMPGRPYITYGQTLEGATDYMGAPGVGDPLSPTMLNLDVLIVLSKASTIERVEGALNQWLGVQSGAGVVSVKAAVAVDPTLGGAVEWCIPLSADPPGPLEYNGMQFFGTRIHFNLSAL